MKYILLLGLFLQLIHNTGKINKKEAFFPPVRTVSYVVKDPTAFNKNHTYILTDEFLGIKDFPEFKLKHAYVYNEHSSDLYNGHLHWIDTPLLIILSKGYWFRFSSLQWKKAKKSDIIYIPPMEIIDDNICFNWMPEKLWIGEEWKGSGDTGGQAWTDELHKVVDHRNGIWYIHTIAIYVQNRQYASCYDERWKDGVEIYQKMTDCHDHVSGEMYVK